MKWPFFFVEHARTHLRLRGCADFFVGASPFPDPALLHYMCGKVCYCYYVVKSNCRWKNRHNMCSD